MLVQEHLCDASKWTQGNLAKDESGGVVGFRDQRAACWCLKGSILSCYSQVGGYPSAAALQVINRVEDYLYEITDGLHGGMHGIGMWNDDPIRTFDDVRRVAEALSI